MKSDLIKMISIGIGLAILMICGLGGLSLIFQQGSGILVSSRAPVITKLAIPTVEPSQLPTKTPSSTSIPGSSGGMTIGAVVQISGTGNVGLRLRLTPGIDGAPQFVAMENEVFIIKDGPIVKDDITWWRLASSYDENRQGWAAGQYLTVFDQD